jgi:hypothetical protein
MNSRLLPIGLLALGLASGSLGCATRKTSTGAQRPVLPAQATQWLRTELYVGAVPMADWQDFLSAVVTPLFPDGFTVLEGYGQWRDPGMEIHQIPTRVLIVLHPANARSEQAIETIRTTYKTRFNHVSVLRSTAPTLVSF